jgi:REP element-mobilizing transposase RayT
MPRKARIDAPGALQHIIVRGIERKDIFRDSLDYSNLLYRIKAVLTETDTPCFAWAFMPNHFHMLLRTGQVPISTVMRRLLTGYAQQFNRRHRRHGPLFQNRFKSILCEFDAYFLELVRYIHLNPLRAGIVTDLNALKMHPYSGHTVILGKIKYEWQDVNSVLGMFSNQVSHARKAYTRFIKKGIEMGQRPELTGGGLVRSVGGWAALKSMRSVAMRIMGDERILGSGDFVESVLEQAQEDYEWRTLAKARGISIEEIIIVVSKEFGIQPVLIKSKSRQRNLSRARAIVCWLAVDKLLESSKKVAKILGMSPSAVSKALPRGRKDQRSESIWNHILREHGIPNGHVTQNHGLSESQ